MAAASSEGLRLYLSLLVSMFCSLFGDDDIVLNWMMLLDLLENDSEHLALFKNADSEN